MANYCELGNLIENQLSLLNKTQSQLALECNVTPGQINHIITGRSNPSIKLLVALSSNLGIDFSTLSNSLLSRNTKVTQDRM